MAGESTMRSRVCKILSRFDAQAVENRVGPGMPDVYTTAGWIECKRTKAFPKREGTPVKLDHELLDTQRVWLRRHARRGGKAWVLTQIGHDFYLHPGDWAADNLGTATRSMLGEYADLHVVGWASLEEHLTEFLEQRTP